MVVNENMPASKALGLMSEKNNKSFVVSERDYKRKNKNLEELYIFISFKKWNTSDE